MNTVDIDKADIIAAVSNDYYDSLKNEAPYINMKFEELGAVCRDFATKDVDDLLATHTQALKAELLAKMQDQHLHSDSRAAELECSEDGYTYGLEDGMKIVNEL